MTTPAQPDVVVGGERAPFLTDAEFDDLFGVRWRRVSRTYWTPVDVASLAIQWLTETGLERVVDVGSGTGKLCLLGALRSRAQFLGVEHRRPLVRAARRAARRLGVQRKARFLHARATFEHLSNFQAFYLYNPFGENLLPPSLQLDDSVELDDARFASDVALMERVLDTIPSGSRVVTYHGFGGSFPNSFRPVEERTDGVDTLRLWVKDSIRATGRLRETLDGVVDDSGRVLRTNCRA